MSQFFSIPFMVALVSGMAMAVQGTLNAGLAQKINLMAATTMVHIIGTIISFATILIFGIQFFKAGWFSVPWYFYLGGVLSVIIIGLVALSIPKIGVSNATTAIIIGQVGTAVLIDHFGWFGVDRLPWSPWQLLGIGMFAAGAKLLFR